MLLQLSKNAFIRQFGPYTYVLNRVSNYDEMFTDAEIFFRWVTREPRDIVEIVNNICSIYPETDRRTIESDFNEFVDRLVRGKVILSGENKAEIISKEEFFSYDVDNPKTLAQYAPTTSEMSHGSVPQEVLEKYFFEHPTIFDLQMDITQACTERCVHCYIPEYTPVFLPYGQIVKVIDEFAEQGGVGLTLSGGECMMHPDFEKIVRYARMKDLIVGVLSNLTLCTDEKIKLLKEGEVNVQVSLYSMDAKTHDSITRLAGSFVKTKAAIEKLHQSQIPCLISCPTMKQNKHDYLDVLAFARSLKMNAQTDFIIMGKMNCDTSNLKCRLDLDETRHVLEDVVYKHIPMNNEYFNPLKEQQGLSDEDWGNKKVCGACVNSICLDADGHYYPCPAFGGVDLGSCYEHDLKWIWNESPQTLRIRSVLGKDFKKCLHCADREYCSTCMCRNFNETGDMFTPAEHFCKVAAINRAVVEAKRHRILKSRNV